MDRGAWWATVHGVAKSQTQLNWRRPAKKRLGNRTGCLSQNQFWPCILSQGIENRSWGRKGLLKVLKLAHTLMPGSANLTYKEGDGNNLVLVAHKVFVTTTYLWCGVQKWAEMIHQGKRIPIKCYLQKPAVDRIPSLSCYFPLYCPAVPNADKKLMNR